MESLWEKVKVVCLLEFVEASKRYSGASTMSSNRFCFYHCVPTSGGFAVSIHDRGSFCLFVSLTGLCEQLGSPFTYHNDDFCCRWHIFCTTGELWRQSKFRVVFWPLGARALPPAGSASAVQAAAKNQEIRSAAVSQQMLENPVSFEAATLCQLWTSGRRGTAEWWKLDWCTLHLCPRGAFVAGDLSIT